ncbi:MAG: hypothetical protein U9R42_04655 [Bacteroidota bacterium]|nr:hypothetical protein [Bacteroidota bacterium]
MSIFFLIIIFLLLSYLSLVIWSFWKRKRLLGTVLIVIPVLLFGILILISNWTFIGLTKDIYSKKYKAEKELFYFDSSRDFHGDGFSIKVDSLKKSDIDYFSQIDFMELKTYPKRHYHLGDYRISNWKKTPIDISDSLQYKFALIPSSEWIHLNTSDLGKIDKYIDLSKGLLNESGNYYAYFFRDHPYGLYGIDLYLISPKNGLIIEINKQ